MGRIEEISLLVENEKYEEALAAIEDLDETQKKRHEILNLLSIISTSCQNWKLAEYYCQEALKQAPDNPDYVYNLAGVCYAAGKYREGVDIIENFSTSDMEIKEELNSLKEDLLQAMADSRKVLMIAYFFPPLGGSGVYRSLKFAKYLPDNKWIPTVIASANPPLGWNFTDASMVSEVPEIVDVHRISDELTRTENYQLKGEDAEGMLRLLSQVFMLDAEAASIYSAILNSPNGQELLLQFPCSELNWAWKVINYIEKEINLKDYPVIYTTSGPYSSHLIGCYFKKKYGIPWIADFRDEWINNPYGEVDIQHNLLHRLLFCLEKIVVTTADRTLCVNKMGEDNYIKTYPVQPERVITITNGYDEEDFEDIHYSKLPNPKFRIAYSGLIYSRERTLVPVLKAIARLVQEKKVDKNKIEVVVMGNNYFYDLDKMENLGLNDIITLIPYSEHTKAIQLCASSDLLLCLVGDGKKYNAVYPTKFFEYLRCGKPILALAPTHGSIDKILRSNNLGLAVPSTSSAVIYNFILNEYEHWKLSPEAYRNIPADIKQFERRTLTAALADVMNHILAEKNQGAKEISANVYDEIYAASGANNAYRVSYRESLYYPSWIQAMRYLVLLERNTKIIEIGCGVGQFANMLFDYGFTDYYGLDFSAEAIHQAKLRNPDYAALFEVGDAFESDIFNRDYDIAIFFEILEHIQKDIDLLKRVKPGKKVMLSVPNFSDKNHVRFFDSEEQISDRYKSIIELKDIQRIHLSGSNVLFIAVGIMK